MVVRAYLVDGVWYIMMQKTKPDGSIELQELAVTEALLKESVTSSLLEQVGTGLPKRGQDGD